MTAQRAKPSRNRATPTRTWLGKVDTFIKFGTGAVGLVAALGFPAVYIHFQQFSIPTVFLPYERALRAGILPAAFLVTLLLYLRWAARDFRDRPPNTGGGELPLSMTPLFLLAALGFLLVFCIWLCGLLSVFVLFFWWLAERLLELVGLPPVGPRVLYVAVALFVTTQIFGGLLSSRLVRRQAARANRSSRLIHIQERLASLVDEPKTFALTWTLGAVVMFPPVSVGLLFATRRLLDLLGLSFASALEPRRILLVGLLVAVIMAVFGVLFLIAVLLGSDEQRERGRALRVLAATLVCGYVATAALYAYALYPMIPQGLGGGRPVAVTLWLEKQAIPEDFTRRLQRSAVLTQGDSIRCEAIYLVHIDDRIAILSDAEAVPGATLVVPRASIRAIASP